MDIIYYQDGIKKTSNIEDIKDNPAWIDLRAISTKEKKILEEKFNLHPLTSEDIMKRGTRIKVEQFSDYLLCVFYAIEKGKKIELVEMDFVIGKNFLITNHASSLRSFEDLKADDVKLEGLFKKGVDFIFHRLLDIEIDNYAPVLEYIDDEVENIEETVADKIEKDTMSKILSLKRQIVLIKRYALPQRDKISQIAKYDLPFISKKAVPYFRDIYDHAVRISDSIDNYREAVSNTFDAYMSAVNNKMSEVMKVLSIIATIALPLTVISGIYGTNFVNLPGSENYYGFWIMIGAMLLMMISMLTYFKRKRWI